MRISDWSSDVCSSDLFSPFAARRCCAASLRLPYQLRMAIQIRTTLDEPETGGNFVPHRPARPEKSEGGRPFKLVSDYEPSGDQTAAIADLVEATRAGWSDPARLGVGKR